MPNPPPNPAPPETPFIERAEQRRLMLRELAEIGMDLARALKRRVEAEAEGGDDAAAVAKRDPADAFQRLSRAIRLTLVLEEKTDEALRALIAGEAQAIEARRETTRPEAKRQSGEAPEAKPRDRDDEEVDRPVTEAPDREVETDMESARLLAALQERLEDDAAYQGREDRPIRETVEALRRDLDLGPDGSPWTGEGWEEPPPGAQPPRPRGSAFPHPGRQGFPIGDRAAQVRAPEPAARPPPRAAHPARRE
jgi:hypothetical protein